MIMSLVLLFPKNHFKSQILCLAIYLVYRRINSDRQWVKEDARILELRIFTFTPTRSLYSLAMNKNLRTIVAATFTSLSNRTKKKQVYLWKQLSLWPIFMQLTWFKTISCWIHAARIRQIDIVNIARRPSLDQASWQHLLWTVHQRMSTSMG